MSTAVTLSSSAPLSAKILATHLARAAYVYVRSASAWKTS